jgi:hypothetical protein
MVQISELKFYYINLDFAIHQNRTMQRVLNHFNLNYERFNAFNLDDYENLSYTHPKLGKLEIENWDLKALKKQGRYEFRKGIFGCFMSHFLILEKELESNKPFVILEDDAMSGIRAKRNTCSLQFMSKFSDQIKILRSKENNLSIVRPGNDIAPIDEIKLKFQKWFGRKIGKKELQNLIVHDQFIKCPLKFIKQNKEIGLWPGSSAFCYIENPSIIYDTMCNLLLNQEFDDVDKVYSSYVPTGSFFTKSLYFKRKDYGTTFIKRNI